MTYNSISSLKDENHRLGSVRQIMDTAGNVVNYYTYEPFGETIEQASDGSLATGDGFMFTGQYFDTEIDQYYLRARQYDPHISRFTARDPIFGKFEEPLTLHRYLYCGNDPLNKIDPLGLDSVALFDGSDKIGLNLKNSADDFQWTFNVSSPEYAAELLYFLSMLIDIDDLYIFDHGYSGVRRQGKQEIGNKPLNWGSDSWRTIASSVEEDGTIHLRGCNIASGNAGKIYIMLLARTGGRKVDAFDDLVYHGLKERFGPDYYSYGNLWLAAPGITPVVNISKGGWYREYGPFRRW